MSLQIFLQGQLLGIERYLSSGDPAARSRRIAFWSEELPAQFLAAEKLSPILLGSSGGGQFLLVLPQELNGKADTFLNQAAAEIGNETGGSVRLIWAATENLGTWKLIRQRIDDELRRKTGTPFTNPDFSPFVLSAPIEEPLPARAVLRGDVDHFEHLLTRSESIETHVAMSVLYRQFFAGEVPRLCDGKADLLFTGGDDFAIAGDWQALIEIATELHRLFERFIEENLKDAVGVEGKTLSMALALPENDQSLTDVFATCGAMLSGAKAVGRDSFHLFGRTIEWKQLPEAASIKDLALRLVNEFRCSTQFIGELRGFYPETQATGRRRVAKFERPWRFYRRLAVTLDPDERRSRSKEYQKVRAALAAEIIGKNVGQARLRPTGRVALEWAGRVAKD